MCVTSLRPLAPGRWVFPGVGFCTPVAKVSEKEIHLLRDRRMAYRNRTSVGKI